MWLDVQFNIVAVGKMTHRNAQLATARLVIVHAGPAGMDPVTWLVPRVKAATMVDEPWRSLALQDNLHLPGVKIFSIDPQTDSQ